MKGERGSQVNDIRQPAFHIYFTFHVGMREAGQGGWKKMPERFGVWDGHHHTGRRPEFESGTVPQIQVQRQIMYAHPGREFIEAFLPEHSALLSKDSRFAIPS